MVTCGRFMQNQKKKSYNFIWWVFGGMAVIMLFPAIVLTIVVILISLFIVLYFIFPKFHTMINNKVINFKNKLFKKKVVK
jgi:uncharacterized membrane protein